ncbi:ATP-binding cassette domain-containing protein [Roseibium sp. CAU 1637]|uniref:ATP-binding cassette domain-containing protein n=1 Tax=Roseibium limicola TaxID=2816037 RepID=A0A939J7J5_9HYPH|nr:branched-chain amino acid ABC transporter ATP-binding protein/permease [Roseibium limicola]MBO0344301.1 ATP-binding cassette domain-containing protein [Roseibium limicola]
MKTTLLQKYQPLWIGLAMLVVLPFAMEAIGLTVNTASVIVLLAIATMGLNLLVGYTGLHSFGHSLWFGVGGYAAALAQLNWFPNQIIAPILIAMTVSALGGAVIGFLILRRRGVYFALLTLALVALSYTIAFRWTDVTGGEDGLGGLSRGSIGSISLDDSLNYYTFVACIGALVLFFMVRLLRSPFGQVIVAIRENQLRASFQGYDIQRYKLISFTLSAMITGLAGSLSGFEHYLVSAESTSVALSGEMLAMVVIGGMNHILGPAIGVVFYIVFRELFSIWTSNWLLYFGLIFVGFVIFAPGGIAGIYAQVRNWLKPPAEETAAMSRRKIYEGLPLPEFLRPAPRIGPVLEVNGIVKKFGGFTAVDKVSLDVHSGQIHALIGPNGAGKTTTFNLISGMFQPDQGSVRLSQKDISGLPPHKISENGLARSFQITNLHEGVSIYENLRLSVQAKHPGRFNIWRDIDSYEAVHGETAELAKFLGLEGIEDIMGGDLSYGGQRLVDLGIALASKPQILLLDEPLAGLAAAERERVTSLVRRMAENIPVLIVEHDLDRVLSLSHQVTVMNQGEVLMSGSPAEVRAHSKVQEIYTGSGTPAVVGRSREAKGEQPVLLEVKDINTFYGKSHILNDACLNIRKGEIVALLGRNGAGKSTLLKTLAGLVPAASGNIRFDGQDLETLSAPDIARLGVGYVPQGRGIFSGMSVEENLALGRLARKTDNADGVVWSEERIYEMFPRLKERAKTSADLLSGGEQQMLAVARALSGNVKLLLLDEPFEGLAPAIVEELFTVFDRLRLELPILIVEHNLDLVLALSDRVFALERGAVFHEGPATALLTDIDYRKEILWL